ncbi:MAG: hypothetical protein LCH43_11595 [Actinobacteria bacterium]|nr:hypothetical protein [Actinomycetota bacterium]
MEALRQALAPCAPTSGPVKEHGGMIDLLGDDSFTYQSSGSDDLGDLAFSNMLVACGDLMLEVSSKSYTSQLNQSELEQLFAPLVTRMSEDQRCP